MESRGTRAPPCKPRKLVSPEGSSPPAPGCACRQNRQLLPYSLWDALCCCPVSAPLIVQSGLHELSHRLREGRRRSVFSTELRNQGLARCMCMHACVCTAHIRAGGAAPPGPAGAGQGVCRGRREPCCKSTHMQVCGLGGEKQESMRATRGFHACAFCLGGDPCKSPCARWKQALARLVCEKARPPA